MFDLYEVTGMPKVRLLITALMLAPLATAATSFQFNIISVRTLSGSSTVAPGQFAVVTYSVTNPQTGAAYDLRTDLAWTQTTTGASRLGLQIGWNTQDLTNQDSGVTSGVALPIAVNALGSTVIANGDGTYTVTAGSPIPPSATGSGEVAMEGHPAGPDSTGAYTVRVPVRSAYKYFPVTGALTARRQVVDLNKCMVCHRSDGTGAAPQLTVHGNNRTEEVQVCVVCHNPNNTDASFRLPTDPKVTVGPYTFPEQSIDMKRWIHGIHATTAGFRRTPLVAIVFNHGTFDASTLKPYPGNIRNCLACHIGTTRNGTYNLPLAAGVLGSTMNSQTFRADGTKAIDTLPANDVNISPIAAVCSSCHDEREIIRHMVVTGGASFQTTQAAIDSGAVQERCASCHTSGGNSVANAHLD